MRPPLPSAVRWLIRRVIPAPRAECVLQDLEDDYARRSGSASWWLARETLSLVRSYTTVSLTRLIRGGSAWRRDLRLVIRGLRRGRLAALSAAALLSVGLTAVLLTAGLAETLLFRQVSASHGDALRRVTVIDGEGRPTAGLSFPELQIIRDRIGGAGVVTMVALQPVVIRVEGGAVQTIAEVVDGRYFALTGTEALAGRTLFSADDRPGSAPTVVISEPFWRQRLGGSPAALGRLVQVNGSSYTVVGIARAPGSPSFLGASVDAWITAAHADPLLARDWRQDVTQRSFTAFALPARARAEVDARVMAATSDLSRIYPERWRDRRLQTSGATVLAGSLRAGGALLASILGALALLILAAAASNIAGALLARAAAMRRQIAIHVAIGSGPAAVVRRQLLEGAMLGLAAAIMAVALYLAVRSQVAEVALLPTLALRLHLPFDAALVGSILAAGVGAGLLLALGPAIWATRVDMAEAMRTSDLRASGGRAITRMRQILVSAQVALAVVLIVGAGLFTRSLDALREADVGFPRDRLVAVDLDVEPAGVSPSDVPALARDALSRVAATPGIVAAAMASRAPIDPSTPSVEVHAADRSSLHGDVSMHLVTSRYFETVGIPIVAGRTFTESETRTAAAVVIINETLAARLWPEANPLERQLRLSGEDVTVRVVGMASNSKYRSIGEASGAHLYRPTPPDLGLTILARTSTDPREALRVLQHTLDTVGPGIVGFFPRTIEDHLSVDLLPTRAAAHAAAVLAALALLLSAVGLYGLVSWFVELRHREIGVRMALGASARDVRALIMRQTLSMALPGLLAGLLLAGLLAVVARAALFGVGPLDPAAYALGVLLCAAIVAAAAYGPTRRATRIDPAVVLRL